MRSRNGNSLREQYILWKECKFPEGTEVHAMTKRLEKRMLTVLSETLLPLDIDFLVKAQQESAPCAAPWEYNDGY